MNNGYYDLEGDGVYIPHQLQRIHEVVQRLKAEDEVVAGLYFMLEPMPTTPPNNHLLDQYESKLLEIQVLDRTK